MAAPAPASARVLIVDDDADSADVLRDLLESEGHEALVARDGSQGILRARSMQPDFILVDLHLLSDERNARDVCQNLASASHPPPRVIAMTGQFNPDEARLRALGFAAHVTKPLEVERLLRLLAH